MLTEFLNLRKYPENVPTMQEVVNMTYGCHQLLTGNGWLHISWNPFTPPRHYIRIGYYKKKPVPNKAQVYVFSKRSLSVVT